jgi:hypothetical protein
LSHTYAGYASDNSIPLSDSKCRERSEFVCKQSGGVVEWYGHGGEYGNLDGEPCGDVFESEFISDDFYAEQSFGRGADYDNIDAKFGWYM